MKRMLLWTTLCCLILGTLTAVGVLHSGGNVQPTVLETRGYGVCQGKPCYRGITPGVTTWEQIHTILAHYQDADAADGLFTNVDGNVSIEGVFKQPFSSMGQTFVEGPNIMDIAPGSVRIPLQAIIQQFGSPCGVTIIYSQCGANMPCSRVGLLFVNYPMMRVIVLPDPNLHMTRLTPDLGAKEIDIFDPAGFHFEPKTCAVYLPGEVAAPSTPWLGFASFQRYLQYINSASASIGSN